MKQILISLSALIFSGLMFTASCTAQKQPKDAAPKVTFSENHSQNKIDVLVDGKLFTTYQWADNVCKPILYPVLTSGGTAVTRGFPIQPIPGEQVDHPHQVGMWLTYGNVNGYDFWGNGSKGLGTKNENGGVISHIKTEKVSEGDGEGVLVTSSEWIGAGGETLLKEHTEFHFIADGALRLIDRITTLTAVAESVLMPDTKEGMFGIRVARQLELPSKGNVTLYSANGEHEKVAAATREDVSGNYLSSEGITGDDVWSSRAKWMDLYGNIGNEKISLVICDHPKNINYPTYWHARGYGLFAANPLGVHDFTKGEKSNDLSLSAGQSVTFRYRVIVSSGMHLTPDEINALTDDFAGKY